MSADREVVVYLPGLDGTGRLLFRQAALLARHDVRAASYPQDREATLDELAALVPAIADGSRCTVLAESFGSLVALRAALDHPAVIRRMVLVNPFARCPRLLSRLLPHLTRKGSRPAPDWTRPIRGAFFFDPSLPRGIRDSWWQLTADVPFSAQLQRLGLANRTDLTARLGEVSSPTVVVVSTNDRVVPASRGRELARALARSQMVEIRAGHAALVHPRVDVTRWIQDSSPSPIESTGRRKLGREGEAFQ